MSRWRQGLLVVAALWITAFGLTMAAQSSQDQPPIGDIKPTAHHYRVGQAAQEEIRSFQRLIQQPLKQPKWIPFEVKAIRTITNVFLLNTKIKYLEINYVGENDWITLEIIPANVEIFIPKYTVEVIDDGTASRAPAPEYRSVMLANGIKAQYMDNGAAQMLLWRDGDLSYQISVYIMPGESRRPVEDIIKIADSFAP